MKKLLQNSLAFIAMSASVALSAQSSLNVTQSDALPIPGQTLANICGYTAPNGNEYALLGGESGMIIVDVTVPTNVVQIVQIPMVTNLWKEIKVYQNYAYVTTEGGGGALQIVDLSAIPATTPGAYNYHTYTGDGAINGQLSTVHALHIDTTKGFCYLYGTNLFSGGAIFLDLNTDPYNPTYAGHYTNPSYNYIHDGYVDNDTLYASHIYEGVFTMVDCTNKSNPVVLATQSTPTNFTHNTWISDDRNFLFTTDENTNSYIGAYDISNPSNIQEVDRIQSWNPNSGSIVHNTHILNNWAVTSWYRDGFVITDVTRPHNLVNVGWYDSYPAGQGNGFDGAWGVYPFFPSGTIVVSNIDEGLFVYSPTYVRACYLEGNVYDSICGTPLSGVTITISSVNVTTTSDISGNYATGTPTPGTYTVTYSKPGYTTVVMNNVVFAPGQVNMFNVAMTAPGAVSLNGHVEDATSLSAIPAVPVLVYNSNANYQFTSDGSGDFFNCTVIPGSYNIVAAVWGYQTLCGTDSINATSGVLPVDLSRGYQDEFTFDLGWTVNSTANAGIWERGEPIGTTFNTTNDANPDTDVNNDCTDQCYVTGNAGGSASQDDVDNGRTTLTSPVMDLTTYGDAWIHYSRWFFNAGGSGNPNDTMFIRLTDGTTTVTIEKVHVGSSNNSSWVNRSYRVSNYLTPTSTMRLIVEVQDFAPGHLVEGAFDNFIVADSNAVAVPAVENASSGIKVYPNPFSGSTTVAYSFDTNNDIQMEVVDLTGRVVMSNSMNNAKGTVEIGAGLAEGIYVVRFVDASGILSQERIVKTK